MIDREQLIKELEQKKIIAILRGYDEEQLLRIVEALEKGGIGFVEVTFDQSGTIPDDVTASHIRMLADTFRGRVRIGAGTVMTEEQVETAFRAGAEYIISPDCFEPVIRKTRALGMLSLPGAFTPTEAANAHRWGADYVKLFPNSAVKISYLKDIMAPLSHIRFLAVGGVTAENFAEYLAIGAKGIGVGSGIVSRDAVRNGDYESITARAKQFTGSAGANVFSF